MPPNQRRSTRAFRIAFMISVGVAVVFFRPMAEAAASDRVMDFCVRGKMPPPAEIFDLS